MGQSLANKVINILFYIIFGVSILLGVIFYAVNSNEEPLLIGAYVLTILAAGTVLVFMIASMFKDKKSLITSLLVLAAFSVLIGISYVLASGVIPTDITGAIIDESLTEAGSRWSGASLYMLYILLGLSFASLIYSEIRGAFK